MSLNMFPVLAPHNGTYLPIGDAEFFGNFLVQQASFAKSANFSNVIVRQLGFWVSCAFAQAGIAIALPVVGFGIGVFGLLFQYMALMEFVFDVRHIFKVFNPIVIFDAVFVVYLHFLWAWTKKRQSDQAVHKILFDGSVMLQIDASITSSMGKLSDNCSGMRASLPAIFADVIRNANNATQIARRIYIFVSRNRTPKFVRETIRGKIEGGHRVTPLTQASGRLRRCRGILLCAELYLVSAQGAIHP